MKETIIGALFVAALAALLYFAFTLGGSGSLGEAFGPPTKDIKLIFNEVTGLKAKNDVLVSGLRRGSVAGFEPREDGSILVIARIDATTTLFKDAKAEIIDSSWLGGKQVAIYPGRVELGTFAKDGVMPGAYVPNVLNALGRMVDRINIAIDNTIKISADVREMIEDTKDGKGPFGVFLRDGESARNLQELVVNIKEASESINVVARDLRTVTNEINNGTGTVHRLIYDEKLSRDLSEGMSNVRQGTEQFSLVMTDVRKIVAAVEGEKGALGTAVFDAQFRDDLKSAVSAGEKALKNASETFEETTKLVRNVNEGKGTLGKLATDPSLYNDLQRAVNTLQQGFEDLREQAPVTAFASVVFQVFQ